MVTKLTEEDLTWLADRIHEQREHLRRYPAWEVRIRDLVDTLLWSAQVDARDGDVIAKDGWVRAGKRLRREDFERIPATQRARAAFNVAETLGTNDARRALEKVKRDHVVPRAVVKDIILRAPDVATTRRVLAEYRIVALAHDDDRIEPKSKMPAEWDRDVDWSAPPETLPKAWKRYQDARIVPTFADGTPAYVVGES